MDIFDKVERTITETSQEALSKTKTMAEIAKLNSRNNEIINLLQRGYEALGRELYARYVDDIPDDLRNISDEIGRLLEEQKNNEEQITTLKGQKKCPGCGNNVPKKAFFCQICGTRINTPEQAVVSDENVCPQCSAPVNPGMKFCNRCGFKLNFKAADTANPVADSSPADPFLHAKSAFEEPAPYVAPEPVAAPIEETPFVVPEPVAAPIEETPFVVPEPVTAPIEETPFATPQPAAAPQNDFSNISSNGEVTGPVGYTPSFDFGGDFSFDFDDFSSSDSSSDPFASKPAPAFSPEPAAAPQQEETCANCGNKKIPNAKFCRFCGNPY